MKRVINIVTLLLFLVGLLASSGCGSASSAPPVSLPTPVTGRITVSSPDEDGYISVIGEDSSVESGATVMAINTNLEESSYLEDILGSLIPIAYADSDFPSVCSETGHACALADDDGAFEISITGSAADEIIIVLIDPITGEEKSDRLKKEVPEGVYPFALPPVSVAVSPDESGNLLVLSKGSDKSDASTSNRVILFDPVTNERTASSITGTDGAVKIAAELSGGDFIEVADIEEGISSIYLGYASDIGYGFTKDFESSELEAEMYIRDMEFIANPSSQEGEYDYLVFSNQSKLYSFMVLDPADPSGVTGFATTIIGEDYTHVSTRAFDSGIYIDPDSDSAALIAGLSEFVHTLADGSVTTTFHVTLYRTLHVIDSGGQEPNPVAQIQIEGAVNPADIMFAGTGGGIIITDTDQNKVLFYKIVLNEEANSGNDIPQTLFTLEKVIEATTEDASFLIAPQYIEVALVDSGHFAMITALNGDETKPDSVVVIDLSAVYGSDEPAISIRSLPIPVGLAPTGIVFNSANSYTHVSCFISHSVTKISESELWP